MARRRSALALAAVVVALTAGCAQSAPPAMLAAASQGVQTIELPAPREKSDVSLEQAIADRRSNRDFRPDPLPLWLLGQLLWAGQGVTGAQGQRAAPSAGALYPLEIYVVEQSRVLHYLPQGHRVEARSAVDLRPELVRDALGQTFVGTAAAVLVIGAVSERTRVKYGAIGDDFVNREAGHAAQNVLLEATALGLSAVPVGGIEPEAVARTLALPPDVEVLYLIPLG
jgi:SagB-type dehydrogenase family enzyme